MTPLDRQDVYDTLTRLADLFGVSPSGEQMSEASKVLATEFELQKIAGFRWGNRVAGKWIVRALDQLREVAETLEPKPHTHN